MSKTRERFVHSGRSRKPEDAGCPLCGQRPRPACSRGARCAESGRRRLGDGNASHTIAPFKTLLCRTLPRKSAYGRPGDPLNTKKRKFQTTTAIIGLLMLIQPTSSFGNSNASAEATLFHKITIHHVLRVLAWVKSGQPLK